MSFSPKTSDNTLTGAMIAPAILLFAVLYLAPLGSLVLSSVRDAEGFTLSHYLMALTSPTFGYIMLRTLMLAVVVTFLSLLAGYPVAYFLARVRGQVAAALLLLVSIPYITSILIRTYAWIVVLSPNGLVNQALRSLGLTSAPLPLVFNSFGVYVGMVQVQLPLMIFPLYAAMTRIDRSYMHAARSLGSSPASAFVRVFVPLSAPGIIAGSTLVFLSCLGFYVTPALLGGPGDYVLAQGISLRVLRLADFAGAATQSAILLAFVIMIFIVARKRLGAEILEEQSGPSQSLTGNGLSRPSYVRRTLGQIFSPLLKNVGDIFSVIRKPVLWCVSVGVLVFLVLPLLVVIPLAFSSAAYLTFPPPGYSLRWFEKFFTDRQWTEATIFSLKMASLSALLSLAVGVPAAFAMVRRRMAFRLPTYLLLISPLVVPQVVVAVAIYAVFAPMKLVGTGTGFVLAYSIIGIPYVVVIAIAGLKRFDRTIERAASSLGASPLTVLRTVTVPLLLPTVVSALLFAFIVAFDDVVFGLFIAGRGATPLPMRMWEDIRYEVSPQIAVVAVLLFGVLAVGYTVQLLFSLYWGHRKKSLVGQPS